MKNNLNILDQVLETARQEQKGMWVYMTEERTFDDCYVLSFCDKYIVVRWRNTDYCLNRDYVVHVRL